MSFVAAPLPSPQELRNKTYHRGYAADDGTRVTYQKDWAKQHLLEGDGLLPLFYDHLSKIDRSHEQRLRGVCLPDTVVYEHNFPRAWYGWDRETQEIIKRPGRDLDARTIFAEFCERKDRKCDVIAQYMYVRGAEAAEEEVGTGGRTRRHHNPDTCVEFFTKETLLSFLTNPKPKPDGVLQRFVLPKGKSSSRHNFQLQAIWSPVVTLVYKRTNRYLLQDTTISVSNRAPTFDGPPHLSSESLVAGSTLNRIDIVCRAIADHITFTEKKPIERLIAYFKEDDEDRLWLMWASSLRVGGDALNPVHVRVPMNMALRVETIRTILPKVEAAKAAIESQPEDASLLQRDVQLFDMTGDRDFARKCGGDLFPVGTGQQHDDDDDAGDVNNNNDANTAGSRSPSGSPLRASPTTAALGGASSASGMSSSLQQQASGTTPRHPPGSPGGAAQQQQNANNSVTSFSSHQQGGGDDTTMMMGSSSPVMMSSSSPLRSNNSSNRHHSPLFRSGPLPPVLLLEKMEREQMLQQQQQQQQQQTEAGSASSTTAGGGGGGRNSPPSQHTPRGPNSARSTAGGGTGGQQQAGGAASSAATGTTSARRTRSGGRPERVFISSRAPFLVLNHAFHPPTPRDAVHPFHRAISKQEHSQQQAEEARQLNREVGRSARKPPTAIVLLPGYKEAARREARRRMSFNTASQHQEDTERLQTDLERAALDVLYESHSRSLGSAKIITYSFTIPVPPILTSCLNEDELESLCRVMHVGSAKFEQFNGQIRAVVTVTSGIIGGGSRRDRPLVQLVDDVKEFFQVLFETNGQTLWDRYCGGAT